MAISSTLTSLLKHFIIKTNVLPNQSHLVDYHPCFGTTVVPILLWAVHVLTLHFLSHISHLWFKIECLFRCSARTENLIWEELRQKRRQVKEMMTLQRWRRGKKPQRSSSGLNPKTPAMKEAPLKRFTKLTFRQMFQKKEAWHFHLKQTVVYTQRGTENAFDSGVIKLVYSRYVRIVSYTSWTLQNIVKQLSSIQDCWCA